MKFEYELLFRKPIGVQGQPTFDWKLTGLIKYVHTLDTFTGKVNTSLYLEAEREVEFTVPRYTFFGLPVKPIVRKNRETYWFHENLLELKPVPNVTFYDCNRRKI